MVGLSPAFAVTIWKTLAGLTVAEVLRQVLAGIEEEGVAARLVRVRRSLDVGAIGSTAAGCPARDRHRAAGQGDGADPPRRPAAAREPGAVLDRAARDRELYRGLGRNAARYARGAEPEPLLLPESSEPLGPHYHARVVALVALERGSVAAVDPVDVEATWPS